jgi:thioredoxin reductase
MAYDVVVVGGSYAGLSAGMQLARARRRVLIVDAGKPRNRFAEAGHGFFGQDGNAPFAIVEEGVRQLRAYPTVEFFTGEATAARNDDGRFVVTLSDENEVEAARLILATGVRDELAPIPGMQERWGKTVLHCPYCHGYEVADRALGVMAMSPLSVHQALLIAEWGPMTFFTQGEFEPDEEAAAELVARGVVIERTPVVELLGDAPELDAVRLRDGRIVEVDAVFTGAKLVMASPLAEQLGCAFDEAPLGPFIRVDDCNQTTVANVYAAGDAARAMQNATLASASGVMAGVCVHRSLLSEREHSLAYQRVSRALPVGA